MWSQFFLENVHFAINIFAALVFFAVFWLYWDAWIANREKKTVPKLAGFFLLSISLLIHATLIESSFLPSSSLTGNILPAVSNYTKLAGYLFLIWGLVVEPLQKHPKAKREEAEAIIPPTVFGFSTYLAPKFVFPALAFIVSVLYIRRATHGLERHLKPIAYSFLIFTASNILSFASLIRDTQNIDLFNLVSAFGPIWIAEHALLLLGIIILGRWAWGYLLKRLITQLFMIFTAASLIIFLLTTVSFTSLLLKNLQDETLSRLETDVKVIKLAIDSKQDELLSDIEVLTSNTQVKDGLTDSELEVVLADISETFLISKKLTTVVIVNENGQVVARGEDSERTGSAISEDPQINRALSGEITTSVVIKEGVIAPVVNLVSSSPVKKDGEIVGAVMLGEVLDSAFVDAIKRATELEVGIYGGNALSASTILAPDGKSRWVGTIQKDEKISTAVLDKGGSFGGTITIFNSPYFGAYLALKDSDEVPVGMLFVGKPQIVVLQTAARSIELTFLIASILIALSVIPSYLISRYITYQIR